VKLSTVLILAALAAIAWHYRRSFGVGVGQ
jgi:hypothetical protein